MHEEEGLLDDMQFDAELEGFLSGSTHSSSGMVNLSNPSPMAFGSPSDAPDESSTDGTAKSDGGSTAASMGAAAAAALGGASAVGAALIGGKFGNASGIVGQALGSVANAAVPTSLAPVKEATGKFLQKAQPWRDFLLPLSLPTANQGCTRLTTNIYSYQTNYAILFVVQLVVAVLLQPSALISIVIIAVAWMLFLKKNEDPDWNPTAGGVQLGPMRRWLLLAAITALVLLIVAGGTIFNAALFYVAIVCVHGMFHDVSAKGSVQDGSNAVPL